MGSSLLIFPPLSANFAGAIVAPQFGVRNGHRIISFDDTVDEECFYVGVMPEGYTDEGLDVDIAWMSFDQITGDAVWEVAFERHDNNIQDLDSDGFATAKTVVSTTAAGGAGRTQYATISFLSTEIDGITGKEQFRLRLRRLAVDSSNTLTNDAQVVTVTMRQESEPGGAGGGGFFVDGAGVDAVIGKGATPPIAGGVNAFAQGNQCEAEGANAFAVGLNNEIPIGSDYGAAFGANHTLLGDQQVAFGLNNVLGIGANQFVGGIDNVIGNGANNFIWGDGNDFLSTAYASVMMGQDNQILGTNGAQVCLGRISNTDGRGAVGLGFSCDAFGDGAVSLGNNNNALGAQGSIALGLQCDSTEYGATAMGRSSNAESIYGTTAIGVRAYSGKNGVGRGNTGIGYMTESYGRWSVSLGGYTVAYAGLTEATKGTAFCAGYESEANGISSVAFGYNSFANGDHSMSQGHHCGAPEEGQRAFSAVRTTTIRRQAQRSFIVKYASTADAVQTNLWTMTLDQDKSYAFRILISARNTVTNTETASFILAQGTVFRDTAGAAVLVGGPVALTRQDSGGGAANLLADLNVSGNDLQLRITGEAAPEIYNWCAVIEMVEVAG